MKGYRRVGMMPAQKENGADKRSRSEKPAWNSANSRQEKERLIQRFLQERQTAVLEATI